MLSVDPFFSKLQITISMSVALYRKYRPQNFSQISGQNHIKTTLKNEVESGRLGHAYLFCGPRGTGKTTMARLVAKAANCLDLQPAGEPCNKCESCAEIMEARSLDVIEIDAASHTGVDNVRENIINNARFTPSKRKYKIFIIDEVHMLSISAFNALLKILEEPPAHIIFILATTEVHKVPVTIISRCQRFDYKKININDLLERLQMIVTSEGVQVDENVLKRIAKYSFGCVRDAESLLEQILSLGEKKITVELAELILPRSDFQSMFELLKFLIDKNAKSAIELINRLMEDGIDINQFTGDFIEFLRKCLLYKVKSDLAELSQEVEEKSLDDLLKILKNAEPGTLVRIIGTLMKSNENFKQAYALQLPLELGIIELCGLTRTENSKGKPEIKSQPVEVEDIEDLENPQHSKDSDQNSRLRQVSGGQAGHSNQKTRASIPQPQPQASSNLNHSDQISLTFSQIKARWPEIISNLKKNNYALCMSLRVSQPVNLVGNKVIIAFPFSLQRERVENADSKRIISDHLEKMFGKKLKVETKIDEKARKNFSDENKVEVSTSDVSDNEVKEVLDIFGGNVIDK